MVCSSSPEAVRWQTSFLPTIKQLMETVRWVMITSCQLPWARASLYSFLINLFIYLVWLLWVFVAAHGLSLVAASRGYSQLRCTGFSLQGHLLLWSTGSRRTGFRSCGSRALERSLSSCGAQAQLLHDMWDLPGPGLEPMSPAWAGRFSTTAPPRKPQSISLKVSECVLVPWMRFKKLMKPLKMFIKLCMYVQISGERVYSFYHIFRTQPHPKKINK